MNKLFTLLLSIFLLSCGSKEKNEEEKHKDLIYKLETNYKNGKISEQELFFRSRDVIYKEDIGDADFNAIKKGFEQDLFANKSICEYYHEYKVLEFDNKITDAERVISPLKKISNLDTAILVNGHLLCPAELELAKLKRDSRSKDSYLNSISDGCLISKYFIKQDLINPSTADFSMFDCVSEVNQNKSLTILRRVSARNKFGIESQFIYKLKIAYLGGNEGDPKNWRLLGLTSEEYK
jgi:hypothetical protein